MAHSAYPHLGVNAIDKLLDVLADLRKIPLPVSPVLGPSTMNIGVITGGRAANVVPDEAMAQILIRIVENSEPLRGRSRKSSVIVASSTSCATRRCS